METLLTASRSARVIAVVNHKGGSAKTTSVVNLAGVFALDFGRKVLVIDIDSQANCTMGLGVNPYTIRTKRIEDILRYDGDPARDLRESLTHAILGTDIEGIDLVPASLNLAEIEIGLLTAMDRERRLAELLVPVRPLYDLILIDCPPTLGVFTSNALFAADYALVPVEASFFGVAGLTGILGLINRVRQKSRDLKVLGVFNTRVTTANASKGAVLQTRENFEAQYIDCPISTATESEKAMQEGRPVVLTNEKHKLVAAYRTLAKILLERMGCDDPQGEEIPR